MFSQLSVVLSEVRHEMKEAKVGGGCDTAVSWYIGIMSDGLIPGWDLFGPPQMTGVGWSSACALHAHVTFWVFTTTI